MPRRINRAIELLEQDQPVYYTGFSAVSYEAGLEMAGTHADYINVSMEHGTIDLPGLDSFTKGLKTAGPARRGHATPAVIADSHQRVIDLGFFFPIHPGQPEEVMRYLGTDSVLTRMVRCFFREYSI